MLSYPAIEGCVNPDLSARGVHNSVTSVRLSPSDLSFYRWLYKLSLTEGFCWAATPYLAAKQRVSERTIYRRLARLRSAGLISGEVDQGVERRVFCQISPGTKLNSFIQKHNNGGGGQYQSVRGFDRGSVMGRVRGLPYDAYTQETTTRNKRGTMATPGQEKSVPVPVVSTVKDQVSPLRAELGIDSVENDVPAELLELLEREQITKALAVSLIREYGIEQVRGQLVALPLRKPKDRGAVLVSSIKGAWSLPVAVRQEKVKKQSSEQEAQNRALRAALKQKQEQDKETSLRAFCALPGVSRGALLDQARTLLLNELGDSGRMMAERPVFNTLVQNRAMQLFCSGSPG